MKFKYTKWKVFRIVSVLLLTFFLIIVSLIFRYETKSQNRQNENDYNLSAKERRLLQDGDILLRQGFGVVSKTISSMLSEDFSISHCAVLRKTDKDSMYVIHSVSSSLSDFDGVQSCSLKRFVKESVPGSILVVRFNKDDQNNNVKIGERAEYYLSKQVPFDNSFDLEDDSEMYCSEFIWKILKDEYDVDVFDLPNNVGNKKRNLNFSVFWDSPFFDIVLNHQE